MLSGATLSASEIAGTAVFRIVVSSDSIKNATATSQGSRRLLVSDGPCKEGATADRFEEFISESDYHSIDAPSTDVCCASWSPLRSPLPSIRGSNNPTASSSANSASFHRSSIHHPPPACAHSQIRSAP